MSLGSCLDRVQKAEQQLFLALTEIVETREYILELVEQAENRHDPKAKAVASQESVSQMSYIVSGSAGMSSIASAAVVDMDDIRDEAPEPSIILELPGEEGVPEAVPTRCSNSSRPEVICDKSEAPSLYTSVQEVIEKTGFELGLSAEDIARAHNLFCLHDTDKSGMLTVSELHVLLTKMIGSEITMTESHKILRQVDKNHDSELDFEEFLMVLCNTREKKREYLESAPYQNKKLNRGFLLKMKGVPYTTVVGFLQKELKEMTAFLTIPRVILIFLLYIISAELHREASVLRSFVNSFTSDIEDNANFAYLGMTPFENGREGFKNIYDVHTIEDFWSWMDLGLVPLFFPSGWGVSEARSNVVAYCSSPFDSMKSHGWNTTNFKGNASDYASTKAYVLDSPLCDLEAPSSMFPDSLKSLSLFGNSTKKPYRLFNEIVAGVRMEQEQLPNVNCRKPEFFGHIYETPCIEENAWAWLSPDSDTVLSMDEELVNKPGGETVYLKSATPLHEVKAALRQLEDGRWLNQKTSKVQILLTTYNNHMDMFAAIYVNIFINRAGQMHKMITPVCISLHPYRNVFAWVSDTVLILAVMRLFIWELREIFREFRERGVRRGLVRYFQSFTHIVDWIYIVCSFFVFTTWFVYCQKVIAFRDVLESANADISGSWPSAGDIFSSSNAEYWEEVDSLASLHHGYLYVMAYYPISIGGRFFAACQAQPRLGLVTATLGMAAKDIFHFLVVLFATLVIFSSSAELLFGLEVDEFENFGRTFISVVRAMLGDFDYVALTKVGRLPAVIWWLSFVVLVNLIMLNMLLAIIMDVYANIKSGLNTDDDDNFPTIWSQTYEILERWKNEWNGTEVPITKILRALEAQKECFACRSSNRGRSVLKLVTVSDLVAYVDLLSVEQAETILLKAHEWDLAVRSPDNAHSMSDIMAKLRVIDLKIQQSNLYLESLDNLEWKEPNETQKSQAIFGKSDLNETEQTWM